MVAAELARIIIDEKNHDQAIVLREKGGQRQIPIAIGFMEASSIQMKLSGIEPPRPLTHDLVVAILAALDARVESLTIDDMAEGVFFAKLRLRSKAGQLLAVDCRPSDGVAIAVRLAIPIFVADKIFAQSVINGI